MTPKSRLVMALALWSAVTQAAVIPHDEQVRTAAVIEMFPDRFLFGTDNVAPGSADAHFRVFNQYAPLWTVLSPDASRTVRLDNYTRLFDEARRRVRAWEQSHLK